MLGVVSQPITPQQSRIGMSDERSEDSVPQVGPDPVDLGQNNAEDNLEKATPEICDDASSTSSEEAIGAPTEIPFAPAPTTHPEPLAVKLVPDDFNFGKVLGEGAYARVLVGTRKATQTDFAVKVMDKKHILRENKGKYVKTEKQILNTLNHPNVIKLVATFQDDQRLYMVLELAADGDLFTVLKNVGRLGNASAQFITAEIVLALEYMHSLNIIHRDLKPENILLGHGMHVKVTDFGTAKILGDELPADFVERKNSFVGTAEYVSPEVLGDEPASFASDIWAVGCIVYQMLAGRPPFSADSEYLTFQKIIHCQYIFPPKFPKDAREFVSRVLLVEPQLRLGWHQEGKVEESLVKSHVFFEGVEWDKLNDMEPPPFVSSLPSLHVNQDGLVLRKGDLEGEPSSTLLASPWDVQGIERRKRLDEQRKLSWSKFLFPNELIVHSAFVEKKKGLSRKKRFLILTDFPRIFYVDPEKMVQKGEIQWSTELKPEMKNDRQFYIHTPSRSYVLEDLDGQALKWIDAIRTMLKQ